MLLIVINLFSGALNNQREILKKYDNPSNQVILWRREYQYILLSVILQNVIVLLGSLLSVILLCTILQSAILLSIILVSVSLFIPSGTSVIMIMLQYFDTDWHFPICWVSLC